MKNKTLYDYVISDLNIYNSIYSLESYVFEKQLLSDTDFELLNKLSDKYDKVTIEETILKCKRKLDNILTNENELFNISVYFKPKKLNAKTNQPEFRPIHTADLITQICIVSLLNSIMSNDEDGKRKLSDLTRLFPSNFYGNIPSTKVNRLFEPWNKKYQEYSENAIEAHKEYNSSKKFINEINLDLKKFFPSIDPVFIYNFVLEKLPVTYSITDSNWMRVILKKLLFFNVIDIERSLDYYYPTESIETIKKEKLFFNLGIPQGLPQAYFFGNICMLIVSQQIDKVFPGDAYYYVDDSIIYCNANDDEFYNDVKELNSKIEEQLKKHLCSITSISNDSLLQSFYNCINYKIEIHDDKGGKSSITNIASEKPLYLFSKPASTISFEINAAIDELEDESLEEKVEAIISVIQYMLDDSARNCSDLKLNSTNNLKLLKRYKKFYAYRLRILKLRKNNEIKSKDINDFLLRYGLNANTNKAVFIKKLEDDIFIVESQLMLQYLKVDEKAQQKIQNQIHKLENSIVNDTDFTCHYFSKVVANHIKFQNIKSKSYVSLDLIASNTIEPFIRVSQSKKIDLIQSLVKILNSIHDKTIPQKLSVNENRIYNLINNFKEEYTQFVFNNSPEFSRKIINALLSKTLNTSLNDDSNFMKIDNRAVYYYELRLMMFIRSFKFDITSFTTFTHNLLSEKERMTSFQKIDLSLFEILPVFKRYVKDPIKIDNLIQTHKYVNGIWKNGSKFLHFYTLHNEEHSIELINNCTRITKTIDYLSIKEEDYYILFLACYLHDISMVLYPNLDRFSENGINTDLIYSQWKTDFLSISDIEKEPKTKIKKLVLDYYKKVNNYFELEIRNNHHKRSSKFIKEQNDLSFIDKTLRQIVAEVSEAHCYNAKDVYKLKSNAKQDVYDEKYLMIILRLADLLDMSKDRVSINILRQNINNMSDVSKFHWISHMAIDNCNIKTKFKKFNSKLLDKNNNIKLREIIQVNIDLNTKLLTTIDTGPNCDNYSCSILKESASKTSMKIRINKGEKCTNKCNFMCKWMMHKHKYLFDELLELNKYLDRNVNNIFKTEFEVNLHFENISFLPPDYMDVITTELNK
jgi:Reverse transcriptase (RNA-dependent DNA polymerase)